MEEKLVFAQKTLSGIIEHFTKLTHHRTKEHSLIDIVFITLAAVIFGAEDWNDVKEYGKEKRAW